MTAKEWLSRGWRIEREIRELEQAGEEALACATRVTAGTEGERVDGGGGNSSERAMAAYADAATEYAALIEERIRELVAVKTEILRAVAKVGDPTLRALLTARYVNFKKWEQIALDIGYSYMQTCRLHGKALEELRHVIECYTPSAV